MIGKRGLTVLALSAVAVIGAAILVNKQEMESTRPDAIVGQRLLTDSGQQLNDVAKIKIVSGAETTQLTKDASGQWVNESKHNFPVDSGKIRELVLGIGELEILEAKTSNPEFFDKLGTVEPSADKPDSTLVVLADKGDKELVALIFGKQQISRANRQKNEYYVRRSKENQNWLVEGKLTLLRHSADWLNKQLTEIEAKRLARASVHHADGETVSIEKAKAENANFDLKQPTGKNAKSAFTVNNIATTMSRLSFTDVLPVEQLPADAKPLYTASIETFDGLSVELGAKQSGDKVYAQLTAKALPATAVPMPNTTDTKEGSPTPQGGATEPGAKPQNASVSPTAEENTANITKEVEALNKRFAGWVFEISKFQSENIAKRETDLVGDVTVAPSASSVDAESTEPAQTPLLRNLGAPPPKPEASAGTNDPALSSEPVAPRESADAATAAETDNDAAVTNVEPDNSDKLGNASAPQSPAVKAPSTGTEVPSR